jgi:tetratricopeptide (TPR) repeat protein
MSDLDRFLERKSVLEEELKGNEDNWGIRKELAHLLYNQGYTKEAADLVWTAPEIPSIDLEIAFAAKVVGKARPSRAIRLLNTIMRQNQGKAVQSLGLANALLHHGMVMQAARFYGAAIEADPDLVTPDLEHFLLWIDDSERLWGDFKEELPKLEQLPWIKRNAEEADRLKKSMDGHTTPISIPGLQRAAVEEAIHPVYVQSDRLRAEVTPPPAVTIPINRVNPKDVVIDSERGAAQPISAAEAAAAAGPVSESVGTPLPQIPVSEALVPTPLVPPGGQAVRSVFPANQPATSTPHPLISQPIPVEPAADTTPVATPVPAPAPTGPTLSKTKTQGLSDGKIRVNR